MIPSDTHPDAERVQVRLLRQAGDLKRSAMASSITNLAIENARAGIRRARPELPEREIDLLFVEVNYGRDLADRLRTYWLQREQPS